MSYLDELNEPQRQAVEHITGPSMIIAGAGSGKTRVLTYRIAHMINNGIDAFNILSLTFTNKAAKEMTQRISSIVGDNEAKNIWKGTFHSVFARILRTEAEKLGYPSNFTIYDTDDAKNLLKAITKELGLDDKSYKPNLVLNRISNAKNNLVSAAAYAQNVTIQSDDRQAQKPMISEIYKRYEKRCFQAGAMDFDDLLFKTNVLLRDFPECLHKYQDKFRYILVDEFQDTNFSQYLIIKQLAAKFENVSVVGDDAQSIYAFRGASIQNILNFKRDYPDTKVFKLEQNYRSTQNIVDAANSIIKNNKDQIKKDVWTSNQTGEKIKVLRNLTDNEEGLSIANSIFFNKENEQLNNKDFAILYRTNAQSRALEEALRRKDIAYRIYGGLSFYQRKEIKDMLAYCRLAINPNDEAAIKRVINYPSRGIGKTSLDKVLLAASENEISIWEVINRLEHFNTGLKGGAALKLREFATKIKSFIAIAKTQPAFEVGHGIASSTGILTELHNDKSPEGVSRYENVQELLNGLKDFTQKQQEISESTLLGTFMEDIALLTDADKDDKKDDNVVTLMTIHASKGLEFPFVFIAGLEENLFPSQLSLNSRADLEEERRLFYVAVTRAERSLTLSYATSRFKWGNQTYCEPSRFIEEIDEAFLDYPLMQKGKKVFEKTIVQNTSDRNKTIGLQAPQRNLVKVNSPSTQRRPTASSNTENINIGDKIKHERFGAGSITNIEGVSPNQKATVNFIGHGEKKLLLKFAKLTVVN